VAGNGRKIDYNLAWRFINEQCFDGELVNAAIHCFSGTIWGDKGQRLYGTYHISGNEILLHTGWYAHEHVEGPLETLYHEMVHQYIEQVLDASDDYADHGKLFWGLYYDGLERLYNKGNFKMAKMKKSTRKKGSMQGGVAPPGVRVKMSAKGSKGYKK